MTTVDIGDNARVEGSVLAGRDVNVHVQRLLDVPPVAERYVVVAAHADRGRVRIEVQNLRGAGFTVHYEPPEDPHAAVSDATALAIAQAAHVLVFWSSASASDPWVTQATALAQELGARRQRAGLAVRDGFLFGRRLDGTPLPAALTSEPGSVAGPVWLALVLTAAGLGLALWARVELGWRIPALAWGLWALSLGVSVGAAALQWMRRPDQLLRVARLNAWARWLDRATVTELLGAAEAVLDAIFGKRLLSVRAFAISALISVGFVVPQLLAWTAVTGEAVAVGALAALIGAGPLAFGNLVFDFGSLLVTRTVLRAILRNPHPVRHVVGLAIDGVLVSVCAVGALATSLLGWEMVKGSGASWLVWPQAVGHFLVALLTGGVHVGNALADPLGGLMLVTALAVLTATFPSLWHGLFLLGGLGNRVAGRRPSRLGAEWLERVAHAPQGPWAVLAPSLALLAVLGSVGTSWWVQRVALPAPEVLTEGQWVGVEPAICGTPCVLGERDVVLSGPFALLRTEVTQELWWSVWDQAEALGLSHLGLPRHPSVWRGAELPVEGVSWCQAVRFANLWTLVEAEATGANLMPVYVDDAGSAVLERCESEGVTWVEERAGYRLPTEDEWEVAARAGTRTAYWSGDDEADLLRVGWVGPNSGWRTHPVGRKPANPLGLVDVHGNVFEWTWSLYNPDAGPGARRVVRGGSFVADPRHARSTLRVGWRPWRRLADRGFRLVRPPAPQP